MHSQNRDRTGTWLAGPAVLELHGAVAERGAGDEIQAPGLVQAVEQAAAVADDKGEDRYPVLIDQAQADERLPEPEATVGDESEDTFLSHKLYYWVVPKKGGH